jgi:fungal STAND N-terminal Goodbye domain
LSARECRVEEGAKSDAGKTSEHEEEASGQHESRDGLRVVYDSCADRVKNSSALHNLRRLLLPAFMSSSTTSETSTANFQSILDAALDSYAKQTGIDLTKHPSADKLQNCRSSDDILQILSETESAFKDYRDQHRKMIGHLRPVVQVVHAFSAVVGEAAGLVSPGIAFFSSYPIFTPLDRCHSNQQRRYLSPLMFSSQYVSSFSFPCHYVTSFYVRLLQASVQAMMRSPTSLNVSRIS